MKKVFLLLLICFIATASFAQGGGHAPADTRVVTKCGFTSSWDALLHREKEGIFAGPDESEVTTFNLAPDLNSWCYTVTITCNQPLNKKQDEPHSDKPVAPDGKDVVWLR